MDLALVTDFSDEWDFWCDRVATPESAHLLPAGMPVVRRVSTDGPGKTAQIRFLHEQGWDTPRYGTVRDLYRLFWVDRALFAPEERERGPVDATHRVVLITDPSAHAGGGKYLATWEEALNTPDALAMEYLAGMEEHGISTRLLIAGRRAFALRYQSATDWRSNVGDVHVEALGEVDLMGFINRRAHRARYSPLCAIDFVWHHRRWYAVDYNVAPGVRGTGLFAGAVTREAFAEAIRAYLMEDR